MMNYTPIINRIKYVLENILCSENDKIDIFEEAGNKKKIKK